MEGGRSGQKGGKEEAKRGGMMVGGKTISRILAKLIYVVMSARTM